MNLSFRPSRAGRRRLHALVALAVSLCLVLTACGGDDTKEEKKAERPRSQPTEGGEQLAALWPLTGLPAPRKTPDHPVLVVKVDNSSSSSPQIGLSKADLVVEELVEGGITRLAAMFYSKVPGVVGPVRSMRATDIGIVKATHAVLIASGAAPPTYARLNKEKVRNYSGGPGYFREGSRRAPYNLMVRLPELVKSIKGKVLVPANYLPWGKESDYSGSVAAGKIATRFSPAQTTHFVYNRKSGKYDNPGGNMAADDQFRPNSVLVLRVQVGDAGYLDPSGSKVPETRFVGKGEALLFHKGKVVRGTWAKQKFASPLKLRTRAGEMRVPAGHVRIQLVPVKKAGGDVTWTK